MKKIKFRGKCLDNAEIVTGNLLVLPNSCFIISSTTFASKDKDQKHFSIFWDETGSEQSQAAVMVYPVDPESVVRLVGYDADGNEVYEDDILVDARGVEWRIHDVPQAEMDIGGVYEGLYNEKFRLKE